MQCTAFRLHGGKVPKRNRCISGADARESERKKGEWKCTRARFFQSVVGVTNARRVQ